MDKAKKILKTAARYALIGAVELLILISRGASWLANRAFVLAAKL